MEVRHYVGCQDLLLRSQVVGGGRAQASCYRFRKKTRLLALWRDWSPLRSLPGEEGPEKVQPKTRYPPTCCIKHLKGGSRSLAHISGYKKNHSPFVSYG